MSLTVYTKPGCFPCRKTIEKFQDAGLIPQIVDISTTPAALEYITGDPADGGLGYSQAPVVVYDRDGTEDHWSGLNPNQDQPRHRPGHLHIDPLNYSFTHLPSNG